MKNIFSIKANARARPDDTLLKVHKFATFGDNSNATLEIIFLSRYFHKMNK